MYIYVKEEKDERPVFKGKNTGAGIKAEMR